MSDKAVAAFKAEVRGFSFHLPLCPHGMPDHIAEDIADGGYGNFEIEVIRPLIREGDTVLDIGAHVGYFTVQFADWVGSQGRVIAFEPSADNFALLGHNVTSNNFSDRVELYHAGLSDVAGTFPLAKAQCNSGDSRVRVLSNPPPDCVMAHVMALDSIREHLPRLDFVKIDTQGYEVRVLQGMREVLFQQPRVSMLLEYWPYGLGETGHTPEEYFALIKELGFSLFLLRDKEQTLQEVDYAGDIVLENEKDFFNILCHKPRGW